MGGENKIVITNLDIHSKGRVKRSVLVPPLNGPHHSKNRKPGWRDFYDCPEFNPFDVAIIDEMSKATVTELYTSLG